MLTTAGMMPEIAGLKNALAAPAIAASTASSQIPGSPAISSTAMAPCAAKRTTIGRDHQRAPREPVGPHAADEQEGDERDRARRQHDAEVGRRARQLEHGERERDADHAVAEQGHRLAEEQQPERPLPQRLEPPVHQSTACRTASATSARGVSDSS